MPTEKWYENLGEVVELKWALEAKEINHKDQIDVAVTAELMRTAVLNLIEMMEELAHDS